MTDQEIKDLFARVLDEAEPPLPEAGEVVAAGRTARRRRALGVSATALAMVLLAGAGTAGAAGLLSGERSVPPQRGIAHEHTPHPTPNVTHFLPSGRPRTAGPDLSARASELLDALTRSVPPGYAVPKADLVRHGNLTYQVRGYTGPAGPATGDWVIEAHTDVYRDGRAGSLWVVWTNSQRYPPGGSPCAASIPLRHHETPARCSVTAVGGIQVRLDEQRLPDGTTARYATVFGSGHAVTLSADQRGAYPGRAPLPAPALSDADLARLVTGPGFAGGD
ncbi:hypothetical protein Athai_26890 [Actinocatenispora thailandica]|uniref:Uncharacterized protein n=1 Tax=Actinocatenispora thailandica TaxID=227318 RepID=A0A7R7DP65_9ACTN|nr:hypothetical protein [Actinocatenispora thailandica]BCJ35186.1 hypothetical protein Athai_26890 [Actinocatenispora thailandica]